MRKDLTVEEWVSYLNKRRAQLARHLQLCGLDRPDVQIDIDENNVAGLRCHLAGGVLVEDHFGKGFCHVSKEGGWDLSIATAVTRLPWPLYMERGSFSGDRGFLGDVVRVDSFAGGVDERDLPRRAKVFHVCEDGAVCEVLSWDGGTEDTLYQQMTQMGHLCWPQADIDAALAADPQKTYLRFDAFHCDTLSGLGRFLDLLRERGVI